MAIEFDKKSKTAPTGETNGAGGQEDFSFKVASFRNFKNPLDTSSNQPGQITGSSLIEDQQLLVALRTPEATEALKKIFSPEQAALISQKMAEWEKTLLKTLPKEMQELWEE